jgi:hypothetical protein
MQDYAALLEKNRRYLWFVYPVFGHGKLQRSGRLLRWGVLQPARRPGKLNCP